jgi:hypothetical protein
MTAPNPASHSGDDVEADGLEELAAFLSSARVAPDCFRLPELDGLLAARALSPRPVAPEEWLGRIWASMSPGSRATRRRSGSCRRCGPGMMRSGASCTRSPAPTGLCSAGSTTVLRSQPSGRAASSPARAWARGVGAPGTRGPEPGAADANLCPTRRVRCGLAGSGAREPGPSAAAGTGDDPAHGGSDRRLLARAAGDGTSPATEGWQLKAGQIGTAAQALLRSDRRLSVLTTTRARPDETAGVPGRYEAGQGLRHVLVDTLSGKPAGHGRRLSGLISRAPRQGP